MLKRDSKLVCHTVCWDSYTYILLRWKELKRDLFGGGGGGGGDVQAMPFFPAVRTTAIGPPATKIKISNRQFALALHLSPSRPLLSFSPRKEMEGERERSGGRGAYKSKQALRYSPPRAVSLSLALPTPRNYQWFSSLSHFSFDEKSAPLLCSYLLLLLPFLWATNFLSVGTFSSSGRAINVEREREGERERETRETERRRERKRKEHAWSPVTHYHKLIKRSVAANKPLAN